MGTCLSPISFFKCSAQSFLLSSVQISAPDRLRSGLFSPLFAAVERLCNACKILQHGKIHLYILYIFATTVALLVWGLNQ